MNAIGSGEALTLEPGKRAHALIKAGCAMVAIH